MESVVVEYISYLDVTHGPKIVDFSWLDLRNDTNKIGGITQISIVQEHFHSSFVAVSVDVFNTASVEARRTTNNAMDLKVGEESTADKWSREFERSRKGFES